MQGLKFLIMFFVYGYRDHRHFHSFPTRRSSDLLVINLRLFANLEAGLPVRTDQSVVSPGELVRPLIELASDNRILWQHSHIRSEEHTSELQPPVQLVCRLLPEKKKKTG